MLLTDSERQKFADYLEVDADSSDGIARQAEKIPGMSELVRKLRAEAAACRIVAAKLKSIESQSVT
jgi:hypothetical protein